MNYDELQYRIALTLIPGVGDVLARNLMAYCGSAKAVFAARKSELTKIPLIGEIQATKILTAIAETHFLKRAGQEIEFIIKEQIDAICYTDEKYPRRLKHCNDAPLILYYKGTADLNAEKILSVVGTRMPSEYGKFLTEKLIADLKQSGVLIVSGLAYGIDVCAHKAALQNGLETVGVMAHGHDRIYPAIHSNTTGKMIKQGGLLSEFLSGTNPDRENFPKRNRIVAGMCDALIVVESKISGGSLITAEIANSYGRDVFAFPGKPGEELSEGCNAFIKRNKAALIENAADVLYAMNWDSEKKPSAQPQLVMPINLNEEEEKILDLLKAGEPKHIDELCFASGINMSKAAGILLQMEFNNIIRSLPGKMYTSL